MRHRDGLESGSDGRTQPYGAFCKIQSVDFRNMGIIFHREAFEAGLRGE